MTISGTGESQVRPDTIQVVRISSSVRYRGRFRAQRSGTDRGITPGTRGVRDMKWEVALSVSDLQVPHFTPNFCGVDMDILSLRLV